VAAMAVVVVYLSEAYSQLKTCYSFLLFCLVTSVKKGVELFRFSVNVGRFQKESFRPNVHSLHYFQPTSKN
jgi:hypothetical protein